ncbi:MAG TPA: hypothetical protein VIK94_01830 [Bacilli bacterium]
MNIQWFSKESQAIATIYETNITLNTVASTHFKNIYATLIGYDKTDDAIVIKAITKDEVTMGLYQEDELVPISIRPSYGRINSKSIINNINKYHPLDFTKKNYYKFLCDWVQEKRMLKVYLKREVS